MTLYEVYTQLRACLGRDDLARLGAAIFYHERGPRGYEAGYGYTDRGALPQWEGRQIEGVCGELKRFFGLTRPLSYSTLEEFARKEWKASDPNWAAGVWRAYPALQAGGVSLTQRVGRDEPPRKPYLGVEGKLQGSLSPEVQARLQNALPEEARRFVLVGLGVIGLAWVWARARGRV